jgi:hypothetical protein
MRTPRTQRHALASLVVALAIAAGAAPFTVHPWRTTDDVQDGWDWSLPPGVKPYARSGISISERKVGPSFPGRLTRSVSWSWKQLEPREGEYDFAALKASILKRSAGGKYCVEFHLRASVWELKNFPDEAEYPKSWVAHMERSATAPRWLSQYEIPLVAFKKKGLDNIGTPFQVVNMDIYHPEYHKRYVRMVRALGESGIPVMPEVSIVFVHLWSASRGEEGAGPAMDDPRREAFGERLRAWSKACEGIEGKLCLVSHRENDLKLAYELGMGQRNGFVEMYMMHCNNPLLGQGVDGDGYLVVDETCPLVAENRASGDENEEYVPSVHVARFGPMSGWPHRYRESMLRVLQMRRNFIWAEGGKGLVDPPLLGYVSLELGKTIETAPDAWCYLRESNIRVKGQPKPVKNFERWLYQRDGEGCRALATVKVQVQKQLSHHPKHPYDYTARRTDLKGGNSFIGFALDDRFLSGGPHRVAIKVTYHDVGTGTWSLVYTSIGGQKERVIRCADTGKVKTATFFLDDAHFRGANMAHDFVVRAAQSDAVISFVRVIGLGR